MTSPRTPPAVKPAAGDPPKGHRWVTLPVDDELVHVKLPRYGDGDEVTVLTRAGYVERGTVDMSNGWCVRDEDGEPIMLAAIAVREHAGSAWTERSYKDAGYETLKLRLPRGLKARLRALADSDGYSIARWIESWIEISEKELREFDRPPKKAKTA